MGFWEIRGSGLACGAIGEVLGWTGVPLRPSSRLRNLPKRDAADRPIEAQLGPHEANAGWVLGKQEPQGCFGEL